MPSNSASSVIIFWAENKTPLSKPLHPLELPHILVGKGKGKNGERGEEEKEGKKSHYSVNFCLTLAYVNYPQGHLVVICLNLRVLRKVDSDIYSTYFRWKLWTGSQECSV